MQRDLADPRLHTSPVVVVYSRAAAELAEMLAVACRSTGLRAHLIHGEADPGIDVLPSPSADVLPYSRYFA